MPEALKLVEGSRDGLPVFELGLEIALGLDAFVTARGGGVSAAPFDTLNLATHVGDDPACVAENRRRVAAAMGLDPHQWITSAQVHGDRVNDVDDWGGGALEGDALFTTRRDVALAVLVADCVPLLLAEPTGGSFAVAHAGWRGLARGVLAATLARFKDTGAVRVVIGPHISAAGYQVGPEVARHFEGIEGALGDDVSERRRLDLGVVTVHQLRRAGVREEHITYCSAATDGARTFFSDRTQRPCGRFALVARASGAPGARGSW